MSFPTSSLFSRATIRQYSASRDAIRCVSSNPSESLLQLTPHQLCCPCSGTATSASSFALMVSFGQRAVAKTRVVAVTTFTFENCARNHLRRPTFATGGGTVFLTGVCEDSRHQRRVPAVLRHGALPSVPQSVHTNCGKFRDPSCLMFCFFALAPFTWCRPALFLLIDVALHVLIQFATIAPTRTLCTRCVFNVDDKSSCSNVSSSPVEPDCVSAEVNIVEETQIFVATNQERNEISAGCRTQECFVVVVVAASETPLCC